MTEWTSSHSQHAWNAIDQPGFAFSWHSFAACTGVPMSLTSLRCRSWGSIEGIASPTTPYASLVNLSFGESRYIPDANMPRSRAGPRQASLTRGGCSNGAFAATSALAAIAHVMQNLYGPISVVICPLATSPILVSLQLSCSGTGVNIIMLLTLLITLYMLSCLCMNSPCMPPTICVTHGLLVSFSLLLCCRHHRGDSLQELACIPLVACKCLWDVSCLAKCTGLTFLVICAGCAVTSI